MRDPESIAVNEDERMIPVWSIIVASVAFVLVEYYFWMVAPEQRHHAPRLPHLLQPFLGRVDCALFPDAGLHQQGLAAPGNERAILDADLLRHAGRHRGGALLPAASAAGEPLPRLRDACAERFPLLSAVQLPAYGELRQLLPDSARHRPVLHPLRP